VVLLPGLMCDAAVWAEQVRALAARHEVFVPDYGELDTLPAMAGQVLRDAPAGPLAVAGHSMGGRVALEMLRQAPQRVARLALLDTSYHPLPSGADGQRERDGRLALLAIAREQGMRAMARQWTAGMLHPSRLGTPLFEAVLDMFERHNPVQFAAQIEALLARPDATALFGEIRCPTLLLCGREDAWSPPARHEFMHARIGGSTLIVLECCGHMSTMEQPDAVTAALQGWLASPASTHQ
jgi:pimeloyl-ACP methyl ester carboxylesterase